MEKRKQRYHDGKTQKRLAAIKKAIVTGLYAHAVEHQTGNPAVDIATIQELSLFESRFFHGHRERSPLRQG